MRPSVAGLLGTLLLVGVLATPLAHAQQAFGSPEAAAGAFTEALRKAAARCATTRLRAIAPTKPRRAPAGTVVRRAPAASRRVHATVRAAPAITRCAAPATPEPRVSRPIVAARAAHRQAATVVVPEPATVVAVGAVAAVASNQESA